MGNFMSRARLSHYFLPVLRENPVEASIASHRFMLRAGMIRQLTSGIYHWLPFGLLVLRKIEAHIRHHMAEAGAIELLMPCIQPAELWQESGRYNDYGKEMLRMNDRHDRAMLFGPTNEEAITDLFRHNVKTYRDLPLNLYHIQWKFRDEIRPRFGVMRGREFLMKDAYSFDLDVESATKSYNRMYQAYLRCFAAMGLKAIPVQADSGAIGGNMSHEFHIIADTGESDIYYDCRFDECSAEQSTNIEYLQSLYAAADEKHDPNHCPIPLDQVAHRRGIEVGHVFYFGTKYSKALNATVTNQQGSLVPVEMGSYGIGASRLVGAIIEACHDEHGIIWPKSVAPFDLGIILMRPNDEASNLIMVQLEAGLQNLGLSYLIDDTSESAGSKFATMDLLGLPQQIILGPKSAAQQQVELKCRKTGEKQILSVESALAQLGR
jgi:prolyl-tRNA synthetase